MVDVMSPSLVMRAYRPADEPALTELWRSTWQKTYPDIDFSKRLDWWHHHLFDELLPSARIIVAEADGKLIGFVGVYESKGYLDQIVIAPESWDSSLGKQLMDEAKLVSPQGLYLHVNQDNERAIRFYQKQGFTVLAEDINPRSGAPVFVMIWCPSNQAASN